VFFNNIDAEIKRKKKIAKKEEKYRKKIMMIKDS